MNRGFARFGFIFIVHVYYFAGRWLDYDYCLVMAQIYMGFQGMDT